MAAVGIEDGTVFEGDIDRLAGLGALVEQVEARLRIVGWNRSHTGTRPGRGGGYAGFRRLLRRAFRS